MQSELLRRARLYEEENRPKARDSLPVYHLTGGIGWINDPNGFSSYRGEVHLFFQYYPYNILWGPMHWGHAKTRDFIRWEHLPAAMAPDSEADRDGCFSGSAIELPDGRQLLLYTGVIRTPLDNGAVSETQTQCVAIGNGIDYEKLPDNPVLGADALPEGGSARDFRDPKIWREDGKYRAVVANRTPDNSGAVLLYESEDALHWRYVATVSACRNRYGTMWECPDLFSLDGKAVLLHSAHEMLARGTEFHPGNGTLCHIGSLDRETWAFRDEQVHSIDYGLDFYAPQTMQTEDGRRIMIGWMQSWESASFPPAGMKFFGQMTVPRELGVRNGRLVQNPVREIERYRKDPVKISDHPVLEEVSLPGIRGRVLDLTLHIRHLPGQRWRRFEIGVAKDETHGTKITLLPEAGLIRIDRTNSGTVNDVVHVREFPARFPDGEIRLRLLMDRYSLEIFVNGGEQAASLTLYTPPEADAITFASDVPASVTAEKYDLATEDQTV